MTRTAVAAPAQPPYEDLLAVIDRTTVAELPAFVSAVRRRFSLTPPAADPCGRCRHQFRHHAVTVDGYRCRACKCKRGYWR